MPLALAVLSRFGLMFEASVDFIIGIAIGEAKFIVEKLLLAFPNGHDKRC